jgi:CYTH domain-containing protein
MLCSMTVEIERSWVVADVPGDDILGPGAPVRQGYLAQDGGVEARVRITTKGAVLTIKAGSGLERTEVEAPIAGEDADALWPFTEGRRIEKVRHRVEVGPFVAEVDVYEGHLDGLCRVEVEFSSREEAASFEPPAWFGREVTGQPGWNNASLAEHGVPPAESS